MAPSKRSSAPKRAPRTARSPSPSPSPRSAASAAAASRRGTVKRLEAAAAAAADVGETLDAPLEAPEPEPEPEPEPQPQRKPRAAATARSKAKHAKHAKQDYGFWAHGSLVDRVDKWLSSHILFLEGHWALDFALLIPGTWFGLPAACWGLIPLAFEWWHLFATSGSDDAATTYAWFLALVAFPTLSYAVYFFRSVLRGDVHAVYSPRGQIPLSLAAWAAIVATTSLVGAADTSGPAAVYAVAWSLGQTVCHIVKFLGGRVRPIAHFAEELARTRREFKELRYLFAVGQTALESFPSADAAGAGATTGVLFAYGAPTWFAVMPSVVAAFARVYFHAHHVFDVAVGLWIGIASARAVVNAYGVSSLSAVHALASAAGFIFVHVFAKRFKPKLPEHLQARDGKRYGDF